MGCRGPGLCQPINRPGVIGTPIDLSRLVRIGKPAHRVHYALAEKGDVKLSAIVHRFLDEKLGK